MISPIWRLICIQNSIFHTKFISQSVQLHNFPSVSPNERSFYCNKLMYWIQWLKFTSGKCPTIITEFYPINIHDFGYYEDLGSILKFRIFNHKQNISRYTYSFNVLKWMFIDNHVALDLSWKFTGSIVQISLQ